jgi:competence protein ComEC
MRSFSLFRKSPFARLFLFYSAGIITASVYCDALPVHDIVLAIVTIVLIASLFLYADRKPGYHTGWLTGMASGIIVFIIGFFNMGIQAEHGNRLVATSGMYGQIVIDIVQPPNIHVKTVKAVAIMQCGFLNGHQHTDRQKVMVYFQKDSISVNLRPGSRIVAVTRLKRIPPSGNPGEFDYSGYLASSGIYNQIYLQSGQWKLSGIADGNAFRNLAFDIQLNLIDAYRRIGLDSTQFSLLSAITLGYKNDLEAQTKQVFSQAGVMHVMALSGFNVAVIALVLNYMLVFFDRSRAGRILKAILIILVIWLFVFVTGLSPSVTRAAVMISFVLIGKLMHRQINTYNILFASAFFLLTVSPSLITDVSFQLSFAAVLGILLYQPIIYRLLTIKNRAIDWIWNICSVSCAAQLTTLPLTLLYFHQFPVYFWLTNLYVVPLVSVIICAAGFFLLISFIDPLLLIIGKILAILLTVLYKSVVFVEILPLSLVENIHISGIQAILLFAAIVCWGAYVIHLKVHPLWLTLSFLVIFQVMVCLHVITLNNQHLFLVADVKKRSVVNLISGRNGLVLGDSMLYRENTNLTYALNNFWIEHGVAEHLKILNGAADSDDQVDKIPEASITEHWLGDNIFLEFAGNRALILKDENIYEFSSFYPIKLNQVVVTGNIKPDFNALLSLLDPELIILDSSVNTKQATQWIDFCDKAGISYWQVSIQGAYLLKIRHGSIQRQT